MDILDFILSIFDDWPIENEKKYREQKKIDEAKGIIYMGDGV